jgi:CBS domain-containing protein
MNVSKMMNPIATIGEDITLKEAAKIMSREGIGSLVLLNKRTPQGIITERDVIKNITKINENISKFINKKLITISPNASIDEAADVMAEKKVKRLIVVKKKKLKGIITATDLIANADEFNEDMEFF